MTGEANTEPGGDVTVDAGTAREVEAAVSYEGKESGIGDVILKCCINELNCSCKS